jgi:hypothetical protein
MCALAVSRDFVPSRDNLISTHIAACASALLHRKSCVTRSDPHPTGKPNYPGAQPYQADSFILDALEAAAWLLPGDRAKEFASSLQRGVDEAAVDRKVKHMLP